jgi:AcrR family transcriptional regulator
MSVPGLYNYFQSKQEMLVAILDITMEDLSRRSHLALAEGRDPVERFSLLVECLALFHTHRRELAFVGASEMRSLDPGPRARIAATRTAQQRMIDKEVEDGVRSGSFRTTRPKQASRAVVMMCTGLAQWYHADGPDSAESVAMQYVEFALDVVRYVEPTSR